MTAEDLSRVPEHVVVHDGGLALRGGDRLARLPGRRALAPVPAPAAFGAAWPPDRRRARLRRRPETTNSSTDTRATMMPAQTRGENTNEEAKLAIAEPKRHSSSIAPIR